MVEGRTYHTDDCNAGCCDCGAYERLLEARIATLETDLAQRTAERDELRASRDVWHELAEEREADAASLQDERDTLAAQVAALSQALQCACFDLSDAGIRGAPLLEAAVVLRDIPAAAARYIAADRVAQAAIITQDRSRELFDRQRAYEAGSVALDDYRRACGEAQS